MKMLPKRPYLLRAFYEWIVDSGMTPHIMVDARSNHVSVPRQFVKDGRIVLNISPTAVNNLLMKDDEISFNARFSGRAYSIWLPIWSVVAIYSKETQDGMSFPLEEYAEDVAKFIESDSPKTPVTLTTVSTAETDKEEELIPEAASLVETSPAEPTDDPEPPKPPKSRPTLRVVK